MDPGPPPGFELTAGDVEDITTTDKRKEYQCHKLSHATDASPRPTPEPTPAAAAPAAGAAACVTGKQYNNRQLMVYDCDDKVLPAGSKFCLHDRTFTVAKSWASSANGRSGSTVNLPNSESFPSKFFESEDPLSPGACAKECKDVAVRIGGNSGPGKKDRITKTYDVTECPEIVNNTNWLDGYT